MNTNFILEEHKKIQLPSFPCDDDFSEWVEELIELDGYYYGLALSFINGEKITFETKSFWNLKERLSNFKKLKDDHEVYQESEYFLDSLEKIVNLLQAK